MGAGIPYGIGCKLAYPEKDVIIIDGDSSALMTLTDIKTIVENKIPIKIAIINPINPDRLPFPLCALRIASANNQHYNHQAASS